MRGHYKKRQAFGRLLWFATGAFLLCLPASALALTPTTTTLALSSASQAHGVALTVTATVTAGATPVTLGTIVFCNAAATYCIDSAVVGTAQLTSAGTASIKIVPGIGAHSYRAIFRPTATYATSTSPNSSMTVTGAYPTSTTLSTSGSAGNYSLTGQVVSSGSLSVSPTGSVAFKDATNGNYSLGVASLGSSTFAQSFSYTSASTVGAIPRQSATGDFNGDGIPDVVVASQDNTVTILLGTGSGAFTASPQSPIATGSTVVAVAVGDFNNDGKLDIVAVNWASGSLSVLLGNGDGTFQPAITVTGLDHPDSIAVGDFNGDGYLDLAVNSQQWDNVTIYLGDGTGAFTYSSTYNTQSQPYSIVTQDLNGDGYPDLVIGNSNASSVTVLLGSATGTFTAAAGSPFTTGAGAWTVALADIDGDGNADLIVGDQYDSNIGILKGNGDGSFGAPSFIAVAAGNKFVATADLNGDGNQDIAVCSLSTDTVSLLAGNGDGSFQAAQVYPLGAGGCLSLTATDFNGDGLPDLEVTLYGNNSSTVLLNTATHTASATISSVSVPGSGSHNVAAAYAGDTQDAASASSAVPLTASKVATSLVLSAAPTSSSYGQQVVLAGTLSPYAVGTLTNDGESITFYNGGTSLGTATLSMGYASLNVTALPAGTDSLTAVFATDANFLAGTSSAIGYSVSKSTPTINWPPPSSIGYGTPLSSTQLNASSGGVAGTFVYTPASGTVLSTGNGQTLSVAFTPTDATSYNSATGSTTINVTQASGSIALTSSAASSPYGSAVTLTAAVPSSSTGTVTFLDGGAPVGTAPISGTTATFTTASLAVGGHSLTASWPGDANHASATSAVLTQAIVRAAAVVAEVAFSNPSIFGDMVTISVSVSGSGATPTGTVLLQDGATTLATLPLDASGSASMATSTLVAGLHTLTVTYQGDTRYF